MQLVCRTLPFSLLFCLSGGAVEWRPIFKNDFLLELTTENRSRCAPSVHIHKYGKQDIHVGEKVRMRTFFLKLAEAIDTS